MSWAFNLHNNGPWFSDPYFGLIGTSWIDNSLNIIQTQPSQWPTSYLLNMNPQCISLLTIYLQTICKTIVMVHCSTGKSWERMVYPDWIPSTSMDQKTTDMHEYFAPEDTMHFLRLRTILSQSHSDIPWQWIVWTCGPITSIPSSHCKETPDGVTTKGNASGGEFGDFATLINLWSAKPIPHLNKMFLYQTDASLTK